MSGVVEFGKNLLFGPESPDPGATAAQQAALNKEAILTSAAVNQINQMGPGYDIQWSGEIGEPGRTMTYTLDPQREQLAQLMGTNLLRYGPGLGRPVSFAGVTPIPGYDDFGERAQQVQDQMYEGLVSRIMPEMERKWDRDITLMANKGLPIGGEAWGDVSGQTAREWQDLLLGAGAQSIGLGQAESDRLFRQQLMAHEAGVGDIMRNRQQIANELGLAYNLNPYTQTQIQTPTQYQIAPPDYTGLVNAQAQQEAANQASMTGGLASLGSAWILGSMLSDRRLKTDIEPIGTTYGGLPLYSFSYVGSKTRHSGVMAQDVLFVNPAAVIVQPDGYLAVDYSKVM